MAFLLLHNYTDFIKKSYNFINIMTTGAVFHYLIPFSAHLIAFPSTLFDFMSITKVICFLFVL